MIVWLNMPNGGGEYNHEIITDFPNELDILVKNIPERNRQLFFQAEEPTVIIYTQNYAPYKTRIWVQD